MLFEVTQAGVIGKLYFNTFMVTLNNRTYFSDHPSPQHVDSAHFTVSGWARDTTTFTSFHAQICWSRSAVTSVNGPDIQSNASEQQISFAMWPPSEKFGNHSCLKLRQAPAIVGAREQGVEEKLRGRCNVPRMLSKSWPPILLDVFLHSTVFIAYEDSPDPVVN
ncbi:hypothetical protein EDB87DRAFT_1578354 [Lactarius vividus]|nr:hypothetical protein EDB87DRAFT_1578354 [Lactarius vividus]